MTNLAKASLSLFTTCLLLLTGCRQQSPMAGWSHYGGTPAMTRYSSLTQIDTSNVGKLQVAWTYHTMDGDTVNHSQIQCNPIVVNGVLYGTTPQMKLFAVDAATGLEKWVFNPFDTTAFKIPKRFFFIMNNSRGVSWWSDDDKDQRLYYTAGSFLYCINAQTGKVVTSFGEEGKVDLHDGLDRDVRDLFITSTSPGVVYQDLIIMGTRVDEGAAAAPGHIRAYDVRTGKRRWIFHTIPQPGELGYETWKDTAAWRHIGGANNWSGMSLDESRGIVFVPTGSTSFDFYGGKRKGDGLFGDCLLALNAATGERIWHFQTVHHDMWDRDLPTPPALITVMRDGKSIDAVAQPTKSGYVFVFERTTGKPLFPIEEVSVPQTSLEGEESAPTQPVPVLPPPFARQSFTMDDVNDLVPDSSVVQVKKRLGGYLTGNPFNPPSRQGTVIFPGFDGGAEWGGPAFDPSSGLLYVNANEMPWVLTMVDVKKESATAETLRDAGQRLYTQYCQSCHGTRMQGSGNFPAIDKAGEKYTAATLKTLLASGRRMMPAFKQLADAEHDAIATWVLRMNDLYAKPFEKPVNPEEEYRKLPYTITGYNKFLTPEGYPAIRPPWGTLNAIDLNSGEIRWKIPFGTYPEFEARGIVTGSENYGGPVVTAGGLVFIAATRDGYMHAYHKKSGKLLWQFQLPVPGFATPSVYEVGGRQYVVIACGGGKLGTKSGDAYVAFALPQE
ncbi:MAG: PQQ-binding-like beta-propeller repeat protein [Cyclobacteriaceae bacterium]|nr:PQQ-binding-like beta-propeller repeat protein [Cyclobacteriaceae bacterium]